MLKNFFSGTFQANLCYGKNDIFCGYDSLKQAFSSTQSQITLSEEHLITTSTIWKQPFLHLTQYQIAADICRLKAVEQKGEKSS